MYKVFIFSFLCSFSIFLNANNIDDEVIIECGAFINLIIGLDKKNGNKPDSVMLDMRKFWFKKILNIKGFNMESLEPIMIEVSLDVYDKVFGKDGSDSDKNMKYYQNTCFRLVD